MTIRRGRRPGGVFCQPKRILQYDKLPAKPGAFPLRFADFFGIISINLHKFWTFTTNRRAYIWQKCCGAWTRWRHRGCQKQNEPPFTQKELARIGIPAHKIDRVQSELARLAADKTLTRAELTQLAKKIAAVLL